jgi:sulfur dioxygenase
MKSNLPHQATQPIQLFDPVSSTFTYIVYDQASREAVIIDPVDDQLDRDIAVLQREGLKLTYIIETHAHADHITSSASLAIATQAVSAGPLACGFTADVQKLKDGDELKFGAQRLQAIATPGHTAGSMCYLLANANAAHVFTGDTLLIGGCGRTDFQSGSAADLYTSITQKLLILDDATVVWPGHDYKGQSRSTVGQERTSNPRILNGDGQLKSQTEFVSTMNALKLPKPKRIDEAVPANLMLGQRHDAIADS